MHWWIFLINGFKKKQCQKKNTFFLGYVFMSVFNIDLLGFFFLNRSLITIFISYCCKLQNWNGLIKKVK